MKTYTRATPADIFRIWRELWGNKLPKKFEDRDPSDPEDDYEYMAIHQIGGGFID